MRNKKGFTLIELLAVILILGIIALIAIPTVNNIINESRKGAFKASIQNIISAIEQQCQLEQLKGIEPTGIYSFTANGVSPKLNVKGSLPTEGIIYVDEECNVSVNASSDQYTATKEQDDDTIVITDKVSYVSLDNYTDELLSKSNTYTYMGGTYLKGIQESNYLWYSGNLYRIMGKDENGNIRLISETNIASISYSTGQANSNVFSQSYIKGWLNNYFLNHLRNRSLLLNTSYCADSTSDVYAARTTCTNTVSDTKVTMLSLDEYRLASEPTTYACSDIGLRLYQWAGWNLTATSTNFQNYLTNNSKTCMEYVKETIANSIAINATYDDTNERVNLSVSYLSDKDFEIFWTLTPLEGSTYSYSVYYIGSQGSIGYVSSADAYGISPVITLPAGMAIVSGEGSLESPIIIENLKETTDRLIDKANSGEYVSLEGKTYRVVETISNTGTKLILDGYVSTYTGYSNMITNMSNNTYLSNLGLTTSDSRLVNYTWNLGEYFTSGGNYTSSLSSSDSTFTSYVGGVRIGEMYSSQSTSIPLSSRKMYWTMTRYDALNSWRVGEYTLAMNDLATYEAYTRPAIVVAQNVTIISGNGTLADPYKI